MKRVKIDCLGYSINADWYEGERTDEIILFLMGSKSNLKRHEDFVNALVHNTGMPVLVIEYSGHGDSPFDLEKIRPAQHLLEVVAAYDWIKDKSPKVEISIISGSYGAYLASHLIAYRPVKNLVIRTPDIHKPETLYDLWADRLNGKNRKSIRSYRHNMHELVRHPIFVHNAKKFTGKTLVVVHDQDELIPQEVIDVYTKAFSADQYIAEGFVHSITNSSPTETQMTAYQDVISNWLK